MPRILIVDKTAGLASSHERHENMAQQNGVELHVFGPRHWIENGRHIKWKPGKDTAYTPHFGEVVFKDYYARHFYTRGLVRAIQKSRPDIIQLLEEPWAFSSAQTFLAAPKIAPQAKLLFYTWENIYRPWVYPSRLSPLYRQIDKHLHKSSHGAVCATEGAKKVLLQKGYSKPVCVAPYGIPNFFFNDGIEPISNQDTFTIGFVGRLLRMKGVDLIIHAMRDMPQCRLLLVGEGEHQPSFFKLAKALNVVSRIAWHGARPENEIPHLIRQMDVLVLPSRRVQHWQEQLGRVLIEAMALGVPVIGSSSGAIPEVIGGAGLLFEENSADSLRQQLQYLYHHPEERNRLAQAGKERALQRFTWPRFAAEICEFYHTILDQ